MTSPADQGDIRTRNAGGPGNDAPGGVLPAGRRWALIGASAALLVAAVAVIAMRGEPSEPIVFRNAFTEGETRTYESSMEMAFTPLMEGQQPTEGTMTATFTQEVLAVHDDGSADIKITVSDVEVSGMSPEVARSFGEGDEVRMRVAPDGQVLSMDGSLGFLMTPAIPGAENPGAADPTSSQLFFPRFPPEAIAPGDSWEDTHEMPSPFGGEPFMVTTSGHHDGFEGTPYGQAARIEQQIDAPVDMELRFAELMGGNEGAEQAPGMPNFSEMFGDARAVFEGRTAVTATTLVLVDGSDLVEVNGDMTMSMRFEFHDLPETQENGAAGLLSEGFSIEGEMRIEMARVE